MKCKECGNSLGYLRIKKKEWVCRNCGEIYKIEEDEDGKEED